MQKFNLDVGFQVGILGGDFWNSWTNMDYREMRLGFSEKK